MHLVCDAGADRLPHTVPGAQARGDQVRATSDTAPVPPAQGQGPRRCQPRRGEPASCEGSDTQDRGPAPPLGLQPRSHHRDEVSTSSFRAASETRAFECVVVSAGVFPLQAWQQCVAAPKPCTSRRVTRREVDTLASRMPLLVPWPRAPAPGCRRQGSGGRASFPGPPQRPGGGRLLGADPTLLRPCSSWARRAFL